jgi:hypothetical protein
MLLVRHVKINQNGGIRDVPSCSWNKDFQREIGQDQTNTVTEHWNVSRKGWSNLVIKEKQSVATLLWLFLGRKVSTNLLQSPAILVVKHCVVCTLSFTPSIQNSKVKFSNQSAMDWAGNRTSGSLKVHTFRWRFKQRSLTSRYSVFFYGFPVTLSVHADA